MNKEKQISSKNKIGLKDILKIINLTKFAIEEHCRFEIDYSISQNSKKLEDLENYKCLYKQIINE